MTTRREYLQLEGIPADEIVGVETIHPYGRGYEKLVFVGSSLCDWLDCDESEGISTWIVYTIDNAYIPSSFDDEAATSIPRNPAGVPRRGEVVE